MNYLLAVDSGNARIKWGLHDGHSWNHHGVVQQGETEQLERVWQGLPEPMRIIISNVAGMGQGQTCLTSLLIGGTAPMDGRKCLSVRSA